MIGTTTGHRLPATAPPHTTTPAQVLAQHDTPPTSAPLPLDSCCANIMCTFLLSPANLLSSSGKNGSDIGASCVPRLPSRERCPGAGWSPYSRAPAPPVGALPGRDVFLQFSAGRFGGFCRGRHDTCWCLGLPLRYLSFCFRFFRVSSGRGKQADSRMRGGRRRMDEGEWTRMKMHGRLHWQEKENPIHVQSSAIQASPTRQGENLNKSRRSASEDQTKKKKKKMKKIICPSSRLNKIWI